MAILRVITNPFRSQPPRQHHLVQVLPFEWVTPRPTACLGAHARSLLLLHPQLRTWYRRLTPLTQSATCRLVHRNIVRGQVSQTPRLKLDSSFARRNGS